VQIRANVVSHGDGIALYDKGEYDRAIEDPNHAITLDPDYAEAYDHRSLA
jgi:hypothetical protein